MGSFPFYGGTLPRSYSVSREPLSCQFYVVFVLLCLRDIASIGHWQADVVEHAVPTQQKTAMVSSSHEE